jgi:hypothetical protein
MSDIIGVVTTCSEKKTSQNKFLKIPHIFSSFHPLDRVRSPNTMLPQIVQSLVKTTYQLTFLFGFDLSWSVQILIAYAIFLSENMKNPGI